MSKEKSKKLSSSSQDNDQQVDKESVNSFKSQHFENYWNYFNENISKEQLQQYKTKLQQNNIQIQKVADQKFFSITIIDYSKCKTVLKIGVSFAYFTFEVNVLNLAQKSKLSFWNEMEGQSLKLIASGGEGSVYKILLKSQNSQSFQKFAIKSIGYKQNKNVYNIIYEYCFNKLFSVLKIGPFINMSFGFDMLIYDDFIEFPMEMCAPFKLKKNNLKKQLAFMHSLGIIHGDIKSENIMWSPTYHKNVFIDFGFTKMLNEQIGQRTKTAFFGTMGYCGDEMKSILYKSGGGHVDLYYNDVIGHSLAIQDKQNKPQQQLQHKIVENYSREVMKNQIVFIENIRLLFLIYEKDFQKVQQFYERNKNFDLNDMVIGLIRELQFDARLEKVLQVIRNNYRHSSDFTWFGVKQKFKVSIRSSHKSQQKNFEKRVQQKRINIQQQFKGAINEVMVFYILFFHEDLTPQRYYKGKHLLKNLMSENPKNRMFWECLAEICLNPYFTNTEIDNLFDKIKDTLEIKDENWFDKKSNKFNLFSKAKIIGLVGIRQYGFNIFEIYEQCILQQWKKNKENGLQIIESYLKINQQIRFFIIQILRLFDFGQIVIGYEEKNFHFLFQLEKIIGKAERSQEIRENKLVKLIIKQFKYVSNEEEQMFPFLNFKLGKRVFSYIQFSKFRSELMTKIQIERDKENLIEWGSILCFRIEYCTRALVYGDFVDLVVDQCMKKKCDYERICQKFERFLYDYESLYFHGKLKKVYKEKQQYCLVTVFNILLKVIIENIVERIDQEQQFMIKILDMFYDGIFSLVIKNKEEDLQMISYDYLKRLLMITYRIRQNGRVLGLILKRCLQIEGTLEMKKEFVLVCNFRHLKYRLYPMLIYEQNLEVKKRNFSFYKGLDWKKTYAVGIHYFYILSLELGVSIQDQFKDLMEAILNGREQISLDPEVFETFGKIYERQKYGDQWFKIVMRIIEAGRGKLPQLVYRCIKQFVVNFYVHHQQCLQEIVLSFFEVLFFKNRAEFCKSYSNSIFLIDELFHFRFQHDEQFLEHLQNGKYNNFFKIASILIGYCDQKYKNSLFIRNFAQYQVKLYLDQNKQKYLSFRNQKQVQIRRKMLKVLRILCSLHEQETQICHQELFQDLCNKTPILMNVYGLNELNEQKDSSYSNKQCKIKRMNNRRRLMHQKKVGEWIYKKLYMILDQIENNIQFEYNHKDCL